jgi:hypothetical protein
MIKPTTNLDQLRTAFYSVFKSSNPFAPVGQERMSIKAIIYPTNVYYLESDQFQALIKTLIDFGEDEFFISLTELESDPFETTTLNTGEDKHWICQTSTFDEYINIELFVENAIYSSKGTWGILLSHESHALFVCTQPFWKVFQKQYPSWKGDLRQFIDLWHTYHKERGINIDWLQPLLNHLTV